LKTLIEENVRLLKEFGLSTRSWLFPFLPAAGSARFAFTKKVWADIPAGDENNRSP
jgi:hypothetical protein